MPQLDRFTFVSQVAWLIIVFISVYFILLRTGLPRLYKILNFRHKKIEKIKEEVINLEKEVYLLNRGVKKLVLSFLKTLKILPDKLLKVIDNNVEYEISLLRKKLNLERELMLLKVSDDKIKRDISVVNMLDKTKFIKDKVSLKKKVLN